MEARGLIRYVPRSLNLLGKMADRRQCYQIWWGDEIVAFANTRAQAGEILEAEEKRQKYLAEQRQKALTEKGMRV